MLTRRERRKSSIGLTQQTFLDELRARGIRTGDYNLPDWSESSGGLKACLDSLFAVTPPTAIYVMTGELLLAVQNYLARRRDRGHGDVTLICPEYHPNYDWCDPQVPHLRWESEKIIRQAVNWVDGLAAGKKSHRQKLFPSRFVGGDAIQTL